MELILQGLKGWPMNYIHFREFVAENPPPSRELTIAYEETENGWLAFGLAYCSASDQFNKKIARKIAGGRCRKQRPDNHVYHFSGLLSHPARNHFNRPQIEDEKKYKEAIVKTVTSFVDDFLYHGFCPREFQGSHLILNQNERPKLSDSHPYIPAYDD